MIVNMSMEQFENGLESRVDRTIEVLARNGYMINVDVDRAVASLAHDENPYQRSFHIEGFAIYEHVSFNVTATVRRYDSVVRMNVSTQTRIPTDVLRRVRPEHMIRVIERDLLITDGKEGIGRPPPLVGVTPEFRASYLRAWRNWQSLGEDNVGE